MSVELLKALITLIIKYGPVAIQAIIDEWNKDEITLEEIQALLIKKPQEYFKREK